MYYLDCQMGIDLPPEKEIHSIVHFGDDKGCIVDIHVPYVAIDSDIGQEFCLLESPGEKDLPMVYLLHDIQSCDNGHNAFAETTG